MPEKPVFVIAVHVGIGASQTHALKQLEKSHPRRAKTIGAIAAGMECAVAAHNFRAVR